MESRERGGGGERLGRRRFGEEDLGEGALGEGESDSVLFCFIVKMRALGGEMGEEFEGGEGAGGGLGEVGKGGDQERRVVWVAVGFAGLRFGR